MAAFMNPLPGQPQQKIPDNWLNFECQRVYIPKPGDVPPRPIGVPKHEWRLFLHMISNFLTFWLAPSMKSLHGFLPGKGIISAWKELMISITKKDYIYEWDFVSYFDRLDSLFITKRLKELGVPVSWAEMLDIINQTPIKLTPKDQIDETPNRQKKEFFDKWGDDLDITDWRPNIMTAGPISVLQHVLGPKDGVAQGSPTSPILSNIVSLEWVKANEKLGYSIVMYADDSVTGSDVPINRKKLLSLMPPGSRPTIADRKSGYVKYAGQELKPLKFLGLSLARNFIRAHSRKGSRLELSKKEMILSELFLELHDKCQTLPIEEALELFKDRYEEAAESYLKLDTTYEKIFAGKLSGFIVNRLQSGSWNLDNLAQDFSHNFLKTSWTASKLNRWELDIFNSSSFGNLSLLNILRYQSKIRGPRMAVRARLVVTK